MSARQYHQNAQECLGWARTAHTEREREIFLQIARTWLEAAERAANNDCQSISATKSLAVNSCAGSWKPDVTNIFVIFIHRLDTPGTPTACRGDNGSVVVHNTRPEAEAAAAELTAANKDPNIHFAVTAFECTD